MPCHTPYNGPPLSQQLLDKGYHIQNFLGGGSSTYRPDQQPPRFASCDLVNDHISISKSARSAQQERLVPVPGGLQSFIPSRDTISIAVLSLVALFLRLFKTRSVEGSTSYWPGWKRIETIFIFGDSYSETFFNSTEEQPNPSNPLGNPPYPGFTSSNGPNWVDFITTTWNSSYVETYNIAKGGATVDSDLVAPYLPFVLSMKQQVEDEYILNYGSSSRWSSDNTLFAIWIGINDVGNSFACRDKSLNPAIFAVYSNLVDQLYVSGARNFLFLNVPPLERTPRTIAAGPGVQATERADVADFNLRLDKLVRNLTDTYADVTAIQFDTHLLFTRVLDDPTVFPETTGYKNVTDWCDQYWAGTPEWDTFDPRCGIAVNEYLWLNNLHPTYPIHNATAHQIALQLSSSFSAPHREV